MQKLQFEQAWNKAIAEKDRERIEQTFEELKLTNNNAVQLTRLSQAKNYKGELLVTVLVNNTSDQPFFVNNTKVEYKENDQVMAKHTFTTSALVVQPKTSMPWTFIYPVESIDSKTMFENGELEIV
ncbi:SLAP domain-containing protein [Aquibacillus saliphilus]|uniref:SLAP domain-containing protein n=1 Tax=Aquibacillus saliphilus TaxID=1909422 RepID=UPI001CF0A1C2|nr:SLAP domain-containing protein [Aquibacillus saliphilus]